MFGATKFLLVRNLRNSKWPDATVERLRSILQQPLWSYLVWSAILSQFVLLVAHPPHIFPAGPSWTVFPILALGELKRTVLPSSSGPQHAILTLNDLRPLHSDHWGER
jgi:hypothetical protein